MLTDAEVEALYRDLETDRVERKLTYGNKRDEIRQAICAYANDLPGHGLPGIVFIGQADNGGCGNLAIDDAMLRDMGGLRSDGNILPFPVMRVDRKTIDGCTVAVVIVEPSTQPPVRLDGRTFIRVGPRRAIATVEEERRLAEKQIRRNLPFDLRPCPEVALDDLDLARFELEYVPSATSHEARRENGRSTREKMRALRLLTPSGHPTAAALLLFGKDARAIFPGAYIQFLRVDGPLLTDPIVSQKEVGGTVPDQVRQIEELLRLNIATDAQIGGPRRAEVSDYPIEALQQLGRNALLHRSYDGSTSPVRINWFSDRIEIMSPGGLYGGVTPQNIWQNVTAYRNPALAEGLKTLGIVERFGFGLLQVRQSLENNGNPPVEFQFIENYVLAVVRRRP
jgi:ATP-dependent DNA helicase RecG